MSFCLIGATGSFRSVLLLGLFIRATKDEEAGKKAGEVQRGVWVRNDSCAMTSETRVEKGKGDTTHTHTHTICPIYKFNKAGPVALRTFLN